MAKNADVRPSFKRILVRVLIIIISLCILLGVAVAALNAYVVSTTSAQIRSAETSEFSAVFDCIIILGCGVRDDGTPSDMLHDRLMTGISLYKAGAAPKIIMSGDHGRASYDEVNVMKQFAVSEGVPSEDIFMDHAGFSTYDSIYRARDVFGCEKVFIVSQKYHLHRALYVADALGLEAFGVSADTREYRGQLSRDIREVLARIKDVFMVIFDARPTYLGDPIPISGSGDVTND